MEKKGKGKNKNKKKKVEKPQKITKSQYLQKIAEQNALLAQARRRASAIEDEYFGAESKYDQLREDVADVLNYLQHEIAENEEEIAEFGITIAEFKEEIKKNDAHYQGIFSRMENEYEEKNLSMKHQLELVNAKLFASDEVRQQREDFLRKRADLQKRLEEMKARHSKEIYEAEKQEIIRQDRMQKERDIRVTNLASDFRQATDIAIGETTNKLIRDNIALSNNLCCMQEIIRDARDSYLKVFKLERNYRYDSELTDEQYEHIIKKYSSGLNRIDFLLKSLEELHDRLGVCQTLVKENRRLGRTIAERECILKEKNEELNDLGRVLDQVDELDSAAKNNFNSLRATFIKLQHSLYDIAKKAKEAIDAEQVQLVQQVLVEEEKELTHEEMEEQLKELKYRVRENAIETVVSKLTQLLVSDSDLQILTPSSESHIASFDSATSDLNRRSSELSGKKIA